MLNSLGTPASRPIKGYSVSVAMRSLTKLKQARCGSHVKDTRHTATPKSFKRYERHDYGCRAQKKSRPEGGFEETCRNGARSIP